VEEKIHIVLDGLRGEETIAALCRREGIARSIYYKWSKEFLEAGKRRLAGDTARAASTGEVTALRREARELKKVVAEQTLDKLGIPRTTFYRWYDRYQTGGLEALEDQSLRPLHVWNVFLTMFVSRSLTSHWMCRGYLLENWRYASRIRKILCLKGFRLSPAQVP
jgi:putative transposase